MAVVVFLKGVNVGGRRFCPSVLARQLRRLGVVSIGAAGTFVVRERRASAALPPQIPAAGRWCVKVLKREGRFVLGQHRREMKAISYLGQLEKTLGAPLAIRSWNTILAIKRVLDA